jgi:hypothetical protein
VNEYHKIQTVFLRDPADKFKTLLVGQYAEPEFEYLAQNKWVFTEKVDGTNIRVMIDGEGKLSFGGKSDNAQIPARLVSRLEVRFFPQAETLRAIFPDGGCLYGEGYGATIQKGGGNYRPDADFVLFDVLVRSECDLHRAMRNDRTMLSDYASHATQQSTKLKPSQDGLMQRKCTCLDWWLSRSNVEDVANKLALDIVPIIGHGTLLDMVAAAKAGLKSKWGNFSAEGIVARPAVELRSRSGHRIITKIKTKDFSP